MVTGVQVITTSQVQSIGCRVAGHFFVVFLHIANTGDEKSLGTSTMRATRHGSHTAWLLHKQANLLPHLLLKPNQIKRKKKLGYSYNWSEFEP